MADGANKAMGTMAVQSREPKRHQLFFSVRFLTNQLKRKFTFFDVLFVGMKNWGWAGFFVCPLDCLDTIKRGVWREERNTGEARWVVMEWDPMHRARMNE